MQNVICVHVMESGEHPDAEETRLGDAHLADAFEMSGDGLCGDVFEDHVRPGWGSAPSEEPHEVRVLQA